MELVDLLKNSNKYGIVIDDYLLDNFYDGYGYFVSDCAPYTPDNTNCLLWVCRFTFNFDINNMVEQYLKQNGYSSVPLSYEHTKTSIYWEYEEDVAIESIKNICTMYIHHKTMLYQDYMKLTKLI